MKLIGKGYWYNVFDLGSGRVLKLEKNLFQKAYGSGFFEGLNPGVIRKLTRGQSEIKLKYERLEKQVDLGLLGHPKFLDGINYEQDKVLVLKDFLIDASSQERRTAIDKYIEIILECWRNGFSELVHNFTINNGIDDRGRVILLDFNEITFFKSDVLEIINSKHWAKSWSLKQIDADLKNYYLQQMDQKITAQSLESTWGRK